MKKLNSWRHQSHLRREAILIFIFTLLLFITGLGHHEFVNFNTRSVLFAQEMLQNGLSFFPTAFGQAYPNHSALSTIFIYLCSLPFGEVTKLSATLPSAIAAALTLAFMYLTAAPLSRRWGVAGVLLGLFTLTFVTTARSISLDQYTTLVTMVCFYIVFSADLFHKPTRWWCLPLLFLFGLVYRGPIGLFVPAGVTGIYYLSNKHWKAFWLTIFIALGAFIVGTTLLLWGAHLQAGHSFMQQVINVQFLSRLINTHKDPIYYYFINSLGMYAITFPLALVVGVAYFRKICRTELDLPLKLLQQLMLWTIVLLVGLSIPNDKDPQNILAIAPAIALISAYLFVDQEQLRWLRFLRKTFAWFCFIFPLLAAILTQVAKTELEHRGLHLSIHFTTIIIVLCALQAIAVALCLIYKSGRRREIIALGIAALVFVAVNIVMVEPIQLHLSQSRQFVRQVEILRQKNPGKLVFYRANEDALLMRYVVNSPQYLRPIIDIQTPEELDNLTPPVYVIMDREEFQRLPQSLQNQWHVVMQGQIGYDDAVALVRR